MHYNLVVMREDTKVVIVIARNNCDWIADSMSLENSNLFSTQHKHEFSKTLSG